MAYITREGIRDIEGVKKKNKNEKDYDQVVQAPCIYREYSRKCGKPVNAA